MILKTNILQRPFQYTVSFAMLHMADAVEYFEMQCPHCFSDAFSINSVGILERWPSGFPKGLLLAKPSLWEEEGASLDKSCILCIFSEV
ncbi:MAG: hypothetical protein HW412_588 [Bacteroidetes bacterium]|nr:hypothetical protein [Bacteroidota bacterium]